MSSLLNHIQLLTQKNISVINIAPRTIKTRRVKDLVKNIKSFEKTSNRKDRQSTLEIGKFISFVVKIS